MVISQPCLFYLLIVSHVYSLLHITLIHSLLCHTRSFSISFLFLLHINHFYPLPSSIILLEASSTCTAISHFSLCTALLRNKWQDVYKMARIWNGTAIMEYMHTAVWMFLKNLNTELPYDSTILLLDMYPKKRESESQRDVCILKFIAALVTTGKIWK